MQCRDGLSRRRLCRRPGRQTRTRRGGVRGGSATVRAEAGREGREMPGRAVKMTSARAAAATGATAPTTSTPLHSTPHHNPATTTATAAPPPPFAPTPPGRPRRTVGDETEESSPGKTRRRPSGGPGPLGLVTTWTSITGLRETPCSLPLSATHSNPRRQSWGKRLGTKEDPRRVDKSQRVRGRGRRGVEKAGEPSDPRSVIYGRG